LLSAHMTIVPSNALRVRPEYNLEFVDEKGPLEIDEDYYKR